MKLLDPNIIFKDDYFWITNEECPRFLTTYRFDDEYEANLAWAIWLQFSKKTKKFTEMSTFPWILKAIFRGMQNISIFSNKKSTFSLDDEQQIKKARCCEAITTT